LSDWKEHEVPESVYRQVSERGRIVARDLTHQGKTWSFGVAQAKQPMVVMRQEGDRYFARQTPWSDPKTAGSIRHQKDMLRMKWASLAREIDEIREHAPDFGISSIEDLPTDRALIADLALPQRVGAAFAVDNLCFIYTGHDEHEWVILKDDQVAGEGFTLTHLVRERGMDAAQRFIDEHRAFDAEKFLRELGR
jgi:hypothetical protein